MSHIQSTRHPHSDTILSIDIGTTVLKLALIDAHGTIIWGSRHPLSLKTGTLTQQWLDNIARSMAERPPRIPIAAVVVSGHGPSLVPLRADGTALEPALMWYASGTENGAGDGPSEHSYFIPSLVQMRRTHPDQFAQTARFLPPSEFIAAVLGGTHAAIIPTAEYRPYYWTDSVLARHNLDTRLFPPIGFPGMALGTVHSAAAARFSIPSGTPIFGGGIDFAMSLIGSNTLQDGATCDRAGSSEGINYCSSIPIRKEGIICLPHLIEGHYNIAVILPSSGLKLERLGDMAGGIDTIIDALLDPDPAARHNSSTETYELVHHLVNRLRKAIEQLQQAGCAIDTMRVCGGQSHNRNWNRFKCNAIQIPITELAVPDAELIGNACCGFKGLGLYDSLPAAARHMVRETHTLYPEK